MALPFKSGVTLASIFGFHIHNRGDDSTTCHRFEDSHVNISKIGMCFQVQMCLTGSFFISK